MKKSFQLLASIIAVIMILVVAATPAFAGDFQSGQEYTLPQGQTINDDLYVAGGTISIAGKVNGDLVVAGGTIDANGVVSEGIIAAGGTVNVRGSAGDDMRLAGGQVAVTGSAAHDAVIAGGSLDFSESAKTGGDLVLSTGSTRLAGSVGRNVMGSGGSVTILGTVQGNVNLDAASITIGPNARINGDLTYRSANKAVIDPGASVGGKITQLAPSGEVRPSPTEGIIGLIIGRLRYLVAPLILGIILFFVAPKMLDNTSSAIRRKPWASFGWGLLVLIVTPIIGLILFVFGLIIGGVTVSLVLLAIYVLLLIVAIVFVATFIGQTILTSMNRSRWWLLLALVVGVIVLDVVTALPFIGPWSSLLVIIFGIGAIMTAAIEGYGRARNAGTI
jgi:cytoskeletal protein CcmA (bactofilin family)